MYDFSCHLLQNRIVSYPGAVVPLPFASSKLSTIKGKILQSCSWQSKVGQEELSLHSGNKAVLPPKERNFVFYVTHHKQTIVFNISLSSKSSRTNWALPADAKAMSCNTHLFENSWRDWKEKSLLMFNMQKIRI